MRLSKKVYLPYECLNYLSLLREPLIRQPADSWQ